MRYRLALSFFLTLTAAPLSAQAPAIPKRPPLDVGLDTNDARNYEELGLKQLAKRPEVATDAFWWASRLDPSWADPVYGRRVALLLASPHLLNAYMSRRMDDVGDADMRRLDSLQLQAYALNPFLYRRLDLELFRGWVGQGTSGADRVEVDIYVDERLKRADEWTRAWMAYSRGQFADAVRLYEGVMKATPASARAAVLADLARAYFMLGNRGAAMQKLALAMAERRSADDKRVVRVYESKAVYEHGIALLHELNDAPDSARAAYERALTEDLSYWPAHRQLGAMALTAGDTARAVAELDQAVQLHETDAALRNQLGRALAAAGRYEEAMAQFKRATELDPDYAAPWFALARIYDSAGYAPQAIEAYQGYVTHAPQRDAQRAPATQRVAALQAEMAAPVDAAAPAAPPKKP